MKAKSKFLGFVVELKVVVQACLEQPLAKMRAKAFPNALAYASITLRADHHLEDFLATRAKLLYRRVFAKPPGIVSG